MNKYTKILLVVLLFCGAFFLASADRGTFGKKKRVELNIEPAGSLKNSIAFNLKSGLQYKGSALLNRQQIGNTVVNDIIISYKKGNTVYILPYKQRVLIPRYSQTDGSKLVIRLGK